MEEVVVDIPLHLVSNGVATKPTRGKLIEEGNLDIKHCRNLPSHGHEAAVA